MKKLLLLAILSLILASTLPAQDAKAYYDQGMQKAYDGKLEEAIALLTKSIELNPGEFVAWFNRGLARAFLNDFEGALQDYEQTLKLSPEYAKGYLNRGTAKKRLTDYRGAIDDYTYALSLDANYSDAYFNRGLVYEMLGQKDSACADYKKVKAAGDKYADNKVKQCEDNKPQAGNYFSILRLGKKADNDKYGFTAADPVKVGTGPNGGPANQRAYLDLLRDAQGKPVKYNRRGSCCPYDSRYGFMDKALLDMYEITYHNDKNEEIKAVVYISMYDYEELKILQGFKTIGEK